MYIAGALNVAGGFVLTGSSTASSTDESNDPYDGAFTVAGGLGVAGLKINVAGDARVWSTTGATETDTGACA